MFLGNFAARNRKKTKIAAVSGPVGYKTGAAAPIQAAQRLVRGACGRVHADKYIVRSVQSGVPGHPAGAIFFIFPRWSTKK